MCSGLACRFSFSLVWQLTLGFANTLNIYFKFFEPCIVIYLRNKNLQYAHFLQKNFNLIIASSTCFGHPSVQPQEDLYMQFYGISFMHPCKYPTIDHTAYMDA
jgi:hypothetical protein